MKSAGGQQKPGLRHQQQMFPGKGGLHVLQQQSSTPSSGLNNNYITGSSNCGGGRLQSTCQHTTMTSTIANGLHRGQPVVNHGYYRQLSNSRTVGGGVVSSSCTQLSFSGSETDVSTTSTENLTCEEKYVLRNSTRQEPQGEESLQLEVGGVRHLNCSSLDQSSCGTIVVHRDGTDDDADDDEELEEAEGGYLFKKSNFNEQQQQQAAANTIKSQVSTTSSIIDFDMSKLPPPPEYPGWLQSELDSSSASTVARKPAEVPSKSVAAGSLSRSQPDLSSLGRWDDHQQATKSNNGCVNAGSCAAHPMARHPPSYRSSPRNGNKNFCKASSTTDIPPPAPGLHLYQRACHSYRSQGDLHAPYDDEDDDDNEGLGHRHVQRVLQRGRSHHRQDSSNKFVEIIMAENRQLKGELESTSYKVYKLQKFEAEIQKVHQAHEELVKSSQKREELEEKVKIKLQLELRRYQEMNRELKAQLDAANGQLLVRHQSSLIGGGSGVDNYHVSVDSIRELQHRDASVAQLIQQNKELLAAKERHEIELAAQRATLCEQRTHIDILDSALTNAQANVVKLEEECRKKQAYVERVGQLQRALASLQVASERRDEMARKLRGQLEKDIQVLRRQLKLTQAVDQRETGSDSTGADSNANDPSKTNDAHGSAGDLQSEEGVDDLKRMAREQEEKIIALETEVSKWEQRYLEENAMRQIAIDAASMPKDAKIAALEHHYQHSSQENEKLISQAHSDKLRHMDELHVANKHCADLDARVRELESRLAERDAMIRVLQKHSIDKDTAAYQSAAYQLRGSPRHTPHTSFHTVDHGVSSGASSSTMTTTSSPTTSDATANAAAVTSAPQLSSASNAISASKESLDEQLKKLDSQLLSKDSIIQALRSEKEKYPNHYWMV